MNFKYITDNIIKFLSNLSQQSGNYNSDLFINKILSSNIIFFDRDKDDYIRIPVISNDTLMSEVSVEKNNKTIDFVPLYYQSQIVKIKPVVLLDNFASQFSVIHELCHLLSIGDYYISGENIMHSYGILSYKYAITDDKVLLTDVYGSVIENEKITNNITEMIIDYMGHRSICEINKKILSEYFQINFK